MSVTADKNQRTMMLAMPFVFVIFVHTFPAGLLVYWITTNLWTVGQQYLVRRTVGPMQPFVGKGDDDDKPAPRAKRSADGDGDDGATAKKRGRPAPAAAAVSTGPAGPPPRSPRKKKKRSGRRR
jgi:YidC/Oxa1 family membrane protein insertase